MSKEKFAIYDKLKEEIEDAIFATGKYLPDECSDLAEIIISFSPIVKAAPEMYEALQGLLNQYEYENDFKPLSHVHEYAAAQKALAKARGEVNQPTGATTQQ